ncbi:MAG: hypothetical protein R3C16_05970 [Hyphomonadaceae bacterium]
MSRKRWIWLGVAIVLIGALAWGAWSMRGQYAYAQIAAGYTAKQTCSCRHVSGRTLDSCMSDLPEDARTSINVREEGNTVRASVLGVISAEATYEEGYGCRFANEG